VSAGNSEDGAFFEHPVQFKGWTAGKTRDSLEFLGGGVMIRRRFVADISIYSVLMQLKQPGMHGHSQCSGPSDEHPRCVQIWPDRPVINYLLF